MDDLQGRSAVVIGGGSGVGRGIALGLADAGASVVVADVELDTARAVAAELTDRGARALAQHVDGTDRQSLARLAAAAEDAHGDIHLLSSNVGVLVDTPLDSATEAQWAWAVEFNLMSHVRAVDVFLPRLRAHGRPAHIVLTASMAALFAGTPEQVGGVHLGLYTATKHAVLGYGESLRGELAPEGIGVSVLCPGMVASNLNATSLRNRPERHGGPVPTPDGPAMPGAMTPEALGPLVVAGIRDDRLHILTHPESRPLLEARHAALVADIDAAAGSTPAPG